MLYLVMVDGFDGWNTVVRGNSTQEVELRIADLFVAFKRTFGTIKAYEVK